MISPDAGSPRRNLTTCCVRRPEHHCFDVRRRLSTRCVG
jgi:hypothetical protein